MLLGCIGDDFTGSSDLGNTLSRQGMRTVQYTGIPAGNADDDVEAGVIALKTRSIPVDEAVKQSLSALDWLKRQGCSQYFFKYCSTFDSTPDGNIGPVAEALANALNAQQVIVCPAFPGAGRSVYQGHLFVNDRLLNESGMENHPLTPMPDADIRRWLMPQTKFTVGHIAAEQVMAGVVAIEQALVREQQAGKRLIVVDAITDAQLIHIGSAARKLPLLTGGSGIAMGLPENFAKAGKLSGNHANWRGQKGKCVALSGSCSTATREQIDVHRQRNPTFEISAADVLEKRLTPSTVADWLLTSDPIPLAYSSADPAVVKKIQQQYGMQNSSESLEAFFADVARLVRKAGVTRLLTAGGETSGAIVEALALDRFEFGPEIDPGVPALRAAEDLVVALKSGNFGTPDYFTKAAGVLATDAKN